MRLDAGPAPSVTRGLLCVMAVVLAAPVVGCGPGRLARMAARPGTANLWVSTSGGSCARESTLGAEVPSGDCGSLNAAYQAASCGDRVYIDAGDYAAEQDLVDKPSLDSCSVPVVFENAPGTTQSEVVFSNTNLGRAGYAANPGGIDSGNDSQGNTNGASNWTLEGVTVKQEITLFPPTANVTIDNVQGGAMSIAATKNVTVENSNFGPCYNLVTTTTGQTNANGQAGPTFSPNPSVSCNSNIKIMGTWTQQSGTVYNLNGLTFKNNVIHDFIDDNSDEATDHFECMFIDGGANITLDSNKFYDCQIYSIFLQPFSGYPITGLTIQNNWFWADQNVEGPCSANGNCPAPPARDSALDFGESSSSDVSNVLVRYNSFDPNDGITVDGAAPSAASNVRFVGNIVGNSGYKPCIVGATYGYNVWLTTDTSQSTPCGTGDSTQATSPFVTSRQTGSTPDDLHLACNNYARSYVTPNSSDDQLNNDIDGNARNPNGPRDAGASAESACGN